MITKCYNKQHNVILPIKTPECLEHIGVVTQLIREARCMSFKHTKCQSLVLNSGRIQGDHILSFREKTVKRLGKVFSCCLKDTNSIKATNSYLEGWLRTVDKSRLPRKFKAWAYYSMGEALSMETRSAP